MRCNTDGRQESLNIVDVGTRDVVSVKNAAIIVRAERSAMNI